MSLVTISSKGQITIPIKVRTFLGVGAKDKLEIVVRGSEVVLQPVKQFREMRGSLKAKKGNVRKVVENTVSKHVLEKD